nr:39S ribosomal protein L21, mitochondrial isoform X2 [Castor canadensis]
MRGEGCAGPGASVWPAAQRFSSQSAPFPQRYVPKTSLNSPPWPEVVLPDPVDETRHHADVVRKVNELIARGQYGRLFAVVHFASHQWKVTSEDLILIENDLDIKCGERIRMEKVLLVGADNFTLLGKPLLSKDLVRVEATVIEKTESWPKINMKFKRRKNFKKKKSGLGVSRWVLPASRAQGPKCDLKRRGEHAAMRPLVFQPEELQQLMQPSERARHNTRNTAMQDRGRSQGLRCPRQAGTKAGLGRALTAASSQPVSSG